MARHHCGNNFSAILAASASNNLHHSHQSGVGSKVLQSIGVSSNGSCKLISTGSSGQLILGEVSFSFRYSIRRWS